MAPGALIVDLDGTLWDSQPWFAQIIGRGDRATEAAALERLRAEGIPAARLIRNAGISQAAFREICADDGELRLYPGVPETLRTLRDESVPLGVVTSLPEWLAAPMLDRLELRDFFGSVIDWGKTSKRKPHPDPILKSLKDLGIERSEEAWYVGDTELDSQAAARAGVAFAWASYGYGATRPDDAVATLSCFDEVLAL